MQMNNDFTNRLYLVTGASSGIGKETAMLLEKRGAKVVLVARNEEKLNAVANQLPNGKCFIYASDLCKIDEIEPLVEKIVEEHGRIDGMVHCAGIGGSIPLRGLSYEKNHNYMLIHYYAFVELIRAITKKKNFAPDGGAIVGISSIASHSGNKAKIAYSSAKAAVEAAMRCMSIELANRRIRVNCVVPGLIRTDMYENFVNRQGLDAVNEDTAKQPLGLGESEDVANAIVFLLSDAAKFITGVSFPVDGGRLATD